MSIYMLYFRRSTSLLLVLCWLLACGGDAPSSDSSSAGPTDAPPNIIFLLADDMRQDMMSFVGNPIMQTPKLDQLARAGIYFNNAFVTTAICSVSRASIMSGQHARRHGLWWFGRPFSPEAWQETYPMQLQQAGYKIGFIGKYGLGNYSVAAEDFDYWAGFDGQGQYVHQDETGNYLHLTRLMGNQMVDFLDQYGQSDAPFALSVSFKAPHCQDGELGDKIFPADSAYLDLYRDLEWVKPAQARLTGVHSTQFRADNEAIIRHDIRFSDPATRAESYGGYHRLVHGIDVQVGRLMEELEARDLADNTIIVFTSDHGFFLEEYGFGGKWFGHEPSVRIPLIIYDPRPTAPKGIKINEMALNIDLAPTLLAMAGLEPPSAMQGYPLTLTYEGSGPENWRQDFFYEHIMPPPTEVPVFLPSTQGVISLENKYLEYYTGWTVEEVYDPELYDLLQDPLEMNNLANSADQVQLRDQLYARMLELKKEAE
ncbi:MAG: sulfatase-like hydrolase/transferase [Bacteroidota bacterium]